jgi:hypothetical protein
MEYVITPRGRGYWIERISEGGSHRLVERHDTEDKALKRLHALKQQAQAAKQHKAASSARGRS